MTRTLSFPVLPVTQPLGTFFTGVARASELLQICKFDFRRIGTDEGRREFLGIQRRLSESRIRDIRKYIRTVDAVFPSSIVISIDERCASLETDTGGFRLTVSEYIDSENPGLNVPFEGLATIIDGQHRLKSLEGSEDLRFDLPFSVFVGIDQALEASIFSIVNLAQTKVNKSLVYDLFSLDRDRSPEKTCHEIAVALDELEESPFKNRIKRLGAATEGRFGETLSQATVVKGILPLITSDPLSDRDIGKRFAFWPDRGASEFETRPFYNFFRTNEDERILANLLSFFSAVRSKWPEAWDSTGRGAMLSKTNGYNGLMRYFRDAFLHLTLKPEVLSKSTFTNLLNKSSLSDEDFTTLRYAPGSSGASALYRDLMSSTFVG